MYKHSVKEMIKDNEAHFSHLSDGVAYYKLTVEPEEETVICEPCNGVGSFSGEVGCATCWESGRLPAESITYEFAVPLVDIGNAVLLRDDKAIYFMRWINKAIKDETLRVCKD
jgi:hypothetical protein